MEQENREAINKTQRLIAETCDSLKELLLRKNKDYGDSAINPLRIFSSADPVEQINVRIDDKLSRIANKAPKTSDEDTEWDLIGYLILKRVAVLAETVAKKNALETEKKDVMAAYGTQIKAKDLEAFTLSSNYNNGYEFRDVERESEGAEV